TVADPDKKDEAKVFEAPKDVFVKGGTTSWRHDQAEAQLTWESERRRDVAAAEKRIAAVPVEHGGGVIHGGALTEHQDVEQAYVELFYLNAKGEQLYDFGEPVRCLADITLVDDATRELCFILICPRCKERGVP